MPWPFSVNEAVASIVIAVPLIDILPVASSDILPVHLTSTAFVSELILMLLAVVLSTRVILGEAGVSSSLIEWPAFVLTCTLGDSVVSSILRMCPLLVVTVIAGDVSESSKRRVCPAADWHSSR